MILRTCLWRACIRRMLLLYAAEQPWNNNLPTEYLSIHVSENMGHRVSSLLKSRDEPHDVTQSDIVAEKDSRGGRYQI